VTDSALWALAGRPGATVTPVREGNAFEETVERLLQAIKLAVAEHLEGTGAPLRGFLT
jgi:hypothetical protein